MKKQITKASLIAAILCASTTTLAGVDTNLPNYQSISGISGNLSSVGSDTLDNLMVRWGEEFKSHYPKVNIHIEAKGSSTAPPALIEGTSHFAPMSRKMKPKEEADFEKKYGYKPTYFRVAIDALVIYVHYKNPLIKGLTLPELDAIFSSSRKCNHKQDITTWGQTGLRRVWANIPIKLYGRNSLSGTYNLFKNKALCKGNFKKTINEQTNSTMVVQSVSRSINGIGYSGLGFEKFSVKAIPLAKKTGYPFIKPSMENILNGKYPLGRFLYIYVNKAPNKPLLPLQAEFIKMILSKSGQTVVEKDGYLPLPAKFSNREKAKLQ